MQMQETLAPPKAPALLECELTGLCNLACTHCYADSGPRGQHGSMTAADWENVITQAAELGVKTIQFIGGEPTLHPDLPRLTRHALAAGLSVTVYSNLVRVSDDLWDLFTAPGLALSTSWFGDPATHEAMTGSKNAWALTRANIVKAVGLGIRVRAAIVGAGQDTAAAEAGMRALGVARVSVHRLQGLGRAAREGNPGDPGELCGNCGDDRAAIMPDGQLTPCVMGRWLDSGNVRDASLGALLAGEAWRQAMSQVPAQRHGCTPASDGESCPPDQECAPASNDIHARQNCAPDCDSEGCGPGQDCAPTRDMTLAVPVLPRRQRQ
jgi:hypothetical protein